MPFSRLLILLELRVSMVFKPRLNRALIAGAGDIGQGAPTLHKCLRQSNSDFQAIYTPQAA
jgi:hypothetical protein